MPRTHEVPLSQSSRANKVTWTAFTERVFIELMHEEFVNGRLKSSTFSLFVWGRICDRLNANPSSNANPKYKKIIEHGLPHFDLCTEMFSYNTATGAWGSRRSRDEYEDTAYSESIPLVPLNELSVPLNEPFESFPFASDDDFASPSSGRRGKRHVNDLQTKKMDMMDKVQESLQGKIERAGPKATEAIERCVEELRKFENLLDQIFTTALERFHSHTTHTMFLKLTENNKLRWLQSLAKLN
ncbi:hypothetical protein Salat_1869200 [Sesamum alatum]|uniref:Myb/SANT-like domain-containing protein n=1 Tax=Sesamum alatum TaxID=300844 RepID=A0AAE1Y445_9LAMI|nr:hypothetical protein Salat_1869200 [Sesamum alatum]